MESYPPILITSISRSGGKLLRTLLDGHPALRVLPFEHWHARRKNGFMPRAVRNFPGLSADERLDVCGFRHARRKLQCLHGEAFVGELFEDLLADASSTISAPALFQTFGRHYFRQLGGYPADGAIVNHCGSLCLLPRSNIEEMFGPARHLLSVRDPRSVWVSTMAMRQKRFTLQYARRGLVKRGEVERHVAMLRRVDGISGYMRRFGDNYRRMIRENVESDEVVWLRFEDLVTEPEPAMQKVADRLGLEWSACLVEPTQCRSAKVANTSFARNAGVDGSAAGDWTGRMLPEDRTALEGTLGREMRMLGYLS